MNNLPKVVAQQRRGWASNPRLLHRKSDALPLSHRATLRHITYTLTTMCVIRKSTPTTTYTTRPTGTVTRIMCWSLSLFGLNLQCRFSLSVAQALSINEMDGLTFYGTGVNGTTGPQ